MRSHLLRGAARQWAYISRKNDELVERECRSQSPPCSEKILTGSLKEMLLEALRLKCLDPRQLVCFFFFLVWFFWCKTSNEVYVAANFSHQQEDEERSEGAGSLQWDHGLSDLMPAAALFLRKYQLIDETGRSSVCVKRGSSGMIIVS